jgi:hypothetical protein
LDERKGFGVRELRELLEDVSRGLSREVAVYLIGGLAMMQYGMKASTKDVDLVFTSDSDEQEFEAALRSCGFRRVIDIPECYRRTDARTIMERTDGMRFDIFVKRVCKKLRLTDGMRRRAVGMGLEGDLRLMTLAPEDIFIFKSVTERDYDLADMALMAGRILDLGAIVDELRTDAVNYRYLPHLVVKLDALREVHGIALPGRRRLTREAEVVTAINILEDRLRHAPLTISEATRSLGEGDGFSRPVLGRMVELGIVNEKDGRFHAPDVASPFRDDPADHT